MAAGRFIYGKNPAHSKTTSEAGPPKWYPDKAACPEDITSAEIEELIKVSESETDDPSDLRRYAKRYAVRRREGRLEWFRSLLTGRKPDGTIEIHGHPFVPGYVEIAPKVLRRLRDKGLITTPEYNRMVNTGKKNS
jgi:hypothetical protein